MAEEARVPRSRPATHPFLFPRAARWLSFLGVKVAPDDPRIAALERGTWESDTLGDDVARYMLEHGSAARTRFDRAIEHGITSVPDAPAVLRALFAQVNERPHWLDERTLELGARVMRRNGMNGQVALSAFSLMSGYLSSCVTKPLLFTGALESMAFRRLAETSQFTWSVMHPEGFGRFSPGFKASVRVRVMHAIVRARLQENPRWDTAAWGVPINQRDMLGTHLQFTVSYVGGVMLLGNVLRAHEREAIIGLWRYVSYLLGADDALLPKTFREGMELASILNASEPGPDEGSRKLARALMHTWDAPARSTALARGVGRFMRGYARYALGDESADALGLDRTAWRFVPPALALVNAGTELARFVVPGAEERAVLRGGRAIEQHVSLLLAGKNASFEHVAQPGALAAHA